MSKGYDVKNWYWIVSGNEATVYSSAVAAYVAADNAAYLGWLDEGGVATRIADEGELKEVFAAQYPDGFHGCVRTISPRSFRQRFTDAEQLAIMTAAMTDVGVFSWRCIAAESQEIDLDLAETAAGVDFLISKGLLDPARKTVILA